MKMQADAVSYGALGRWEAQRSKLDHAGQDLLPLSSKLRSKGTWLRAGAGAECDIGRATPTDDAPARHTPHVTRARERGEMTTYIKLRG